MTRPIQNLTWYEALENISPVGIFFTDADGNCLHVNRRWCEIAGLTPEEALGRGWIRGIHEADQDWVLGLWYACAGENKPFQAEYRFCTPEGQVTWVKGAAKAILGDDGAVEGYVGTITDITQSRQQLSDLDKSQEGIRTIVKEMPVILFAFDDQGDLCTWNREAERVTGYSAEELVGNPETMNILCPDASYRRKMLEIYKRIGNDYLNWEWELTAKDGSVKVIEFSNISRYHPIEGWANWGIGVDVSSRKKTENALRERVKELNCLYNLSILSNHPDLDLDTFFQDAVELLPPAWQYPEVTSARIIYEDRIFQTRPFDISRWKLASALNVRGRKVGVVEIYYDKERPPAAEGPFLHEERLLLDEIALQISSTIGHVLARRDLDLMDELSARAEELEEFSHTVTHDLKTPLTAISGFAQLLAKQVARGNLDQARYCAGRVVDICRTMENRLEEILKLAKIGRIIDPFQEIDLKEVIDETLALLAPKLKSSQVAVDVAPTFPKVLGDRTRLCEVVENLLENAVCYIGDPPNSIEIGCRREGEETVFYVRDNGTGIDPEHLDVIFEPFRRLEKDRDGHGLGLTIVKRIVEAHGGRIWAESAGKGKGSCFCFTLGKVIPREDP